MKYAVVLRNLSVCIAFVVLCPFNLNALYHFPSQATAGSLFPCLQSIAEAKETNRIAVLHGPDWVLGSLIKPSCFPERDVVLTAEIGKQFLPHSITARTRLWVTKVHDVTHIRIVESSGIERQDMVAVSIVTNHGCIDRNSEHCSVKGGAALVRID